MEKSYVGDNGIIATKILEDDDVEAEFVPFVIKNSC